MDKFVIQCGSHITVVLVLQSKVENPAVDKFNRILIKVYLWTKQKCFVVFFQEKLITFPEGQDACETCVLVYCLPMVPSANTDVGCYDWLHPATRGRSTCFGFSFGLCLVSIFIYAHNLRRWKLKQQASSPYVSGCGSKVRGLWPAEQHDDTGRRFPTVSFFYDNELIQSANVTFLQMLSDRTRAVLGLNASRDTCALVSSFYGTVQLATIDPIFLNWVSCICISPTSAEPFPHRISRPHLKPLQHAAHSNWCPLIEKRNEAVTLLIAYKYRASEKIQRYKTACNLETLMSKRHVEQCKRL